MAILTKRTQLDEFKLKVDKTFSDQILKFEDKVQVFKDAGGTLEDTDLAYLLVKALPFAYKEKLSNLLPTTTDGKLSYDTVKKTLLTLWDRELAWNLLQRKPEEDQGLYAGETPHKGQGRPPKDRRHKNPKSDSQPSASEAKSDKFKKNLSKTSFKCFNCNQDGHRTFDCPNPLTLEARKKMSEARQKRRNPDASSSSSTSPFNCFAMHVQGGSSEIEGVLPVGKTTLSMLPSASNKPSTPPALQELDSSHIATALVNTESCSLMSLSDFDFAPSVAPTFAQLFPDHALESSLVASNPEKPCINPKMDWIIDSGCTKHMVNNPDLFTNLTPYDSEITTAGTSTKVTGIGLVQLKTEVDGKVFHFNFHNTLLVPTVPINLISQSKLEEQFYISTLHGFEVRTRKDHQVVMTAKPHHGLYIVNRIKETEMALLAKETLSLWHERMGHINPQRLKTMKNGSATGISFSDEDLKHFNCETCKLGKAHRSPIHGFEYPRAEIPGELLCWDTCGPMTASTSGNKYMVLGVDSATRKLFVGFHPSKDSIHNTVKTTVTSINTQRGANTVKRIHSDNGGEFISKHFKEWLDSLGIIQTSSASHTPEHNGLAERAIQTVVSAARCMLIASGLPTRFWQDAVTTAVQICNMAPIKPNNNLSSLQLWENKVPDVSKVRTFGCRVLVKIPEPQGKFTLRTWEGIHLGPSDKGDGYRIYDPQTKKINISRDVYFLEGQNPVKFHKSPLVEKLDHAPDSDSVENEHSSDEDSYSDSSSESGEEELKYYHPPSGLGNSTILSSTSNIPTPPHQQDFFVDGHNEESDLKTSLTIEENPLLRILLNKKNQVTLTLLLFHLQKHPLLTHL
jgi:hypothetical protein